MPRSVSRGEWLHNPGEDKKEFRKGCAESGFTLSEILVSLAILALISGMIGVFLGQMKQAARIHAGWDAQYELDSVTRYLERTLESALALPIDIQRNDSRLFFQGSRSTVEFVNASRIGIQEAALSTNSIRLDSGDIVQTIKMRRFSPASSSSDEVLEVTILDDVSDIRFEYLGNEDGSEGPIWSGGWNRERSLPRSIRFAVTAQRDNRVLNSRGIVLIRNGAN